MNRYQVNKLQLAMTLMIALVTAASGIMNGYINQRHIRMEKEMMATMQAEDAALKRQDAAMKAQQRLIEELKARLREERAYQPVKFLFR